MSEASDKPVKQRDPVPPMDVKTGPRNFLVIQQAQKIHRDLLGNPKWHEQPMSPEECATLSVTNAEALCAELVKRGRL